VVLDVLTSLVSFGDLGGVKPTLEAQDCSALVKVGNISEQRFPIWVSGTPGYVKNLNLDTPNFNSLLLLKKYTSNLNSLLLKFGIPGLRFITYPWGSAYPRLGIAGLKYFLP